MLKNKDFQKFCCQTQGDQSCIRSDLFKIKLLSCVICRKLDKGHVSLLFEVFMKNMTSVGARPQ